MSGPWLRTQDPDSFVNRALASRVLAASYDPQDGRGTLIVVGVLIDGTQYRLKGEYPSTAAALDAAQDLCNGITVADVTGG